MIAVLVTLAGIYFAKGTGFYWLVLLGIFFQAGYFLGYYLDPDYDQESTTLAKWRMMRDFKILGAAIVGWFMPYGFLFKHRSDASHFPGLSSFIRLFWLFCFPIFPIILYFLIPYTGTTLPLVLFFGIWLGLSYADAVHSFADWGIIKVRGRR